MQRLSIAMISVDRSKQAQEWKHNQMLAWLVDNKPEFWRKVWSMENPGNDGGLSLYLLKDAAAKTVDMPLLRQEFRPNSGNIGTAP